jgi:thymidylate synthase
MIKADQYYIENLNNILNNGFWDENPRPKYKDGTPAYSKFITGVYETYDLSKNELPITTLRNTAIKTGIKEILWIYQKQSNSLELAREMGINWWDDFEVSENNIGQRYGATIKKYDLMNKLLKSLKEDPFSRRHIIDMYQYSDLEETSGLFPCAFMTMWSVRKINDVFYLDLTLIQRSNDYIMAGYINKIQYVALQMMVAGHLDYKVGMFNHLTQNLHVYDRHFDAVKELLNRVPLDNVEPTIRLMQNKNFYEYTVNDFILHHLHDIPKLSKSLEIAI